MIFGVKALATWRGANINFDATEAFILGRKKLEVKKIILIMGLPGAGKTTLASKLVPLINAKWLNADEGRREANDWDFSGEGRKRQAKRMAKFAEKYKKEGRHVVADFICPTPKARELFNADYVIWVDTIAEGRYEDTNKMFVKPEKFDFRVPSKNAEFWCLKIADKIIEEAVLSEKNQEISATKIRLEGKLK